MDVLESVRVVDEQAAVLSTGQYPEKIKDLLVIGSTQRSDFFDGIRRILPIDIEVIESDDALIVKQEDKVGIAYYDEASFLALASSIFDGLLTDPIIKHWSVGPWLPEVFASDMSRSLMLRSGSEVVGCAVGRFSNYPAALRKGIIQRTISEITIKSAMLEVGTEELPKRFLCADACLAAIRLLYANESIYFRGLKYEPITRQYLTPGASELSRELFMSPSHSVVLRASDYFHRYGAQV